MDDSEYVDAPAKGDKGNAAKIKALIDQLEPLAEQEGCSVEELVAKYADEEDADEHPAADDNKVGLIAARMKAKFGSAEE